MAGTKLVKSGMRQKFSGEIAVRAVKTFDRASGIIVLTVWGAALAFVGLAYLGIGQTIEARGKLAEAESAQPVLPVIAQEPIATPAIQDISDRLAKRYGDKIIFAPNGSQLHISATAPEIYTTWMEAVSYLDTISPDTQWTISQFCVGPECKDGLMSVTLDAQHISFTAPPPLDDNGS